MDKVYILHFRDVEESFYDEIDGVYSSEKKAIDEIESRVVKCPVVKCTLKEYEKGSYENYHEFSKKQIAHYIIIEAEVL